ncbi:MAG: EamA family transporter [Elainellaceae cyanobacterium]
MALPEGSEQRSDGSISGAAAESTDELSQTRENLQAFQNDLVAQLTTDIDRLQQEKAALLETNRHLRSEQQDLQEQQALTSRQQLAQQQQWAKQLAQALASRLYALLVQKLESSQANQKLPTIDSSRGTDSGGSSSPSALENAIQELNRYEGSMAERLNRMTQLEQRGEALLDALNRQLEQPGQAARPVEPTSAAAPASNNRSSADRVAPQTSAPPRLKWGQSPFQIGLIFILLSTVALSLHNVIVGIIGAPTSIFSVWEVGGFIELKSLDSSLLILWLRMVIVMPLMSALAAFIYPPTWRDLRGFVSSRDRKLLRNVCGSGAFLFMSQVLIYISIGQIGPGIAVTILFMYPIITVPLAWLLFGDRPTPLRVGVMVAILVGIILASLPNLTVSGSISFLGVITAVLAGVAFAFYLISMQLSFRRLHPVPVSVIQFFTIFLLTNLILLFRPAQITPFNPLGLILSGLVLGTLTLLGYLLNNFGVRLMGAARASIVASSGPVLTALLAFIITPGPRTVLSGVQIIGVLGVTVGVTALAFERLLAQQAKRRQRAAAQQ